MGFPMNARVDAYLSKIEKWQEESRKLRAILIGFPLTEELKWGQPCYTVRGKNVAIISGFKEYCALAFFKGAAMADPRGILVAPGKVQAGRQIRFGGLREIVRMESTIKSYIAEAIEVERAGLKVKLKAHSEYTLPEELQRVLDAKPSLKTAFEALTPGRQRGYMFYIAAPKQEKTRQLRAEKCIPRILDGKGLND
jgi:uncharacterized protein YdeI (YjbR/CyaY-like superfamily)